MRVVNWDDLASGAESVRGWGRDRDRKTAVTIGVFDGMHLGHRALIEKIVSKAPALVPAALTFRENPKKTSRTYGGDILAYEEKRALFEALGVELCVCIDFFPDFCKIGGRDFFSLLCRFLSPAYAVIGSNFHCGRGRDTDAKAFAAFGKERGVEVEIVPPVLSGGLPVSSSRIREEIRAGRFEEASALLGRPLEKEQRFPQNGNAGS